MNYREWERRQAQADRIKRLIWTGIMVVMTLLLVRLLSSCGPAPECPSDVPLKCYTEPR